MFEWSMIHSVIITLIIICCGGRFFVTTSAYSYCRSSRFDIGCGSGYNLGYPFFNGSYSGDYDCGNPLLEVHCLHGRPVLNISNNLYYVLKNDNTEPFLTIRLVGVEVAEEECPQPKHNLTIQYQSMLEEYSNYAVIYFYNCSSGYPENTVQHLPCLDAHLHNNSTRNTNSSDVPALRSFAFDAFAVDEELKNDGYDWYANCQENVITSVESLHLKDYTQELKMGFTIGPVGRNECFDCEDSGGHCLFSRTHEMLPLCSCENDTRVYHGTCKKGFSIHQKVTIGACGGIGSLLLSILCLYRRKWPLLYRLCQSSISGWKAKIKTPSNVELFLESAGCFGLQRYKYSEIKKITDSFKESLGHGGFGSVFKGKLQDGRLVAVKVLNELKGRGDDFINEVATIGRTRHINVVSLLGFCSSGTKRALVYEFMPYGSLEKVIYGLENASITNLHLGWEKLYQIAVGIAKGLEYLHHGCNPRNLHFDIKPHNILLNEDFCPKITDFGLAKLCSTRQSIISMIGGRGTIGYTVPEVGNRIFGGVSHKSDVYSYGMMILEMIGGRKNLDLKMENMSEIYFPLWIYNHFQQNMNVDRQDIYKEDTTKKMITVALWCIQTLPADRPSISKVVEMLEGDIEELQMPPNPFQNPPSRHSP